jgi:hypothetical protein
MVGHTPHPLLLTQEGHIYLSISTQKKDLGQSRTHPKKKYIQVKLVCKYIFRKENGI